jgi:hypothetical protein
MRSPRLRTETSWARHTADALHSLWSHWYVITTFYRIQSYRRNHKSFEVCAVMFSRDEIHLRKVGESSTATQRNPKTSSRDPAKSKDHK